MARDRYSLLLKCPGCGRSGQAHVSENDGWSFMRGDREREVDSVPEGFTVVDHGRNRGDEIIIHCECGSVAETSLR